MRYMKLNKLSFIFVLTVYFKVLSQSHKEKPNLVTEINTLNLDQLASIGV